mmetsp:Transcript_5838/g.18416  ORF Transcript_5838/g.18416 Transcript_5838/m.18416 type:complete len:208 (-) Transcript_5838:83-706(-)
MTGRPQDWRYYRRTGATWTDLYNTPERRIRRTGLVTRASLRADVAGLDHICAVVAAEHDIAGAEEARRNAQAARIRKEFVARLEANRLKPGGADYRRSGPAAREGACKSTRIVSARTERRDPSATLLPPHGSDSSSQCGAQAQSDRECCRPRSRSLQAARLSGHERPPGDGSGPRAAHPAPRTGPRRFGPRLRVSAASAGTGGCCSA